MELIILATAQTHLQKLERKSISFVYIVNTRIIAESFSLASVRHRASRFALRVENSRTTYQYETTN